MREEARNWDRAQAKERMRALRNGGSSPADVARNSATRMLIAAHRDEFEGYIQTIREQQPTKGGDVVEDRVKPPAIRPEPMGSRNLLDLEYRQTRSARGA